MPSDYRPVLKLYQHIEAPVDFKLLAGIPFRSIACSLAEATFCGIPNFLETAAGVNSSLPTQPYLYFRQAPSRASRSPLALEVALNVQEEFQTRLEDADRLRRIQVDRAAYEAKLARRRYMQVDPENRLVADSLEADIASGPTGSLLVKVIDTLPA